MDNSKILAVVREEVEKAMEAGQRDIARNVVMRLRILQVNAVNDKLTDEQFREFAVGVLDQIVGDFDMIAHPRENKS